VLATESAAESGGLPGPEDASRLFRSAYGASLSDGAVRQQRSFMLLEYPYHEELATDLFVAKDRIEPGAGVSPEPLPAGEPGSSRAADGLPFDQGLSYDEVVSRLADAAMRQAREAPETLPTLGRSARAEEVQPSSDGAEIAAAARVRGEARGEQEAETADDPLSLSSLLSHGGPVRVAATPAELPFDEGLSYEEVVAKVARAVQPVPQAELPPEPLREAAASEPERQRTSPVPPALPLSASVGGRGRRDAASSSVLPPPVFIAAGFALFLAALFAGMAVVALRPGQAERVRTEAGPAPTALEQAVAVSDDGRSEAAPVELVAKGPVRAARDTAPSRVAREPVQLEVASPPVEVAAVAAKPAVVEETGTSTAAQGRAPAEVSRELPREPSRELAREVRVEVRVEESGETQEERVEAAAAGSPGVASAQAAEPATRTGTSTAARAADPWQAETQAERALEPRATTSRPFVPDPTTALPPVSSAAESVAIDPAAPGAVSSTDQAEASTGDSSGEAGIDTGDGATPEAAVAPQSEAEIEAQAERRRRERQRLLKQLQRYR
jgi:hypothetical protein